MKDNENDTEKSVLDIRKKKSIERLNFILEDLGLENINQFSEKMGYARPEKLYKVMRGENAISKNLAKEINDKFPKYSEDWLLTGEGEMLNDDEEKISILKPNKDAPELTGYYYPNVSASAGLDISTLNQELEKVPIYLPNFGKGIDFINVYGDSMYPKYNAGEIIGIKLIEFQYLNYGYPYVVIFKNGDAYIKYVKKGKDENHVLLESENTFYEPREFNIDLIQNFYSIRGVIKKEMM